MDTATLMQEIHGKVEKDLDRIKNSDRKGFGAINWADLHCTDVQSITNIKGQKWYRVVIEEASPSADNNNLILSVYGALKTQWPDLEFEVSPEW